MKKIGLALGGGGARALAHMGVLKALVRNNIPIDIIAGTSMGAIIGAMYAINPDLNQIEKKLYLLLESPEFKDLHFEVFENEDKSNPDQKMAMHKLKASQIALVSAEKVEKIWPILLPNITIEETKIPFTAVATDIIQGQEVLISKGSVYKACQASVSLPGVMTPVASDNNQLLVDGGVISVIPVEVTRKMGADFIIAVEIEPSLTLPAQINTALEVEDRADFLTNFYLAKCSLAKADVIISPEVKNYHWASFHCLPICLKEGERKTEETIPQIKKMLGI